MEGGSRRGPPAPDAGRTKGSLRTSAKCRNGAGGELVKEVEIVEREATVVELTERLARRRADGGCRRRLLQSLEYGSPQTYGPHQKFSPERLYCCVVVLSCKKLNTILASKGDIERLISVGSDLTVRTLLLNYIVFGG
jgi:hypothetical protein